MRHKENRQVELAKSILESNGYSVAKKYSDMTETQLENEIASISEEVEDLYYEVKEACEDPDFYDECMDNLDELEEELRLISVEVETREEIDEQMADYLFSIIEDTTGEINRAKSTPFEGHIDPYEYNGVSRSDFY